MPHAPTDDRGFYPTTSPASVFAKWYMFGVLLVICGAMIVWGTVRVWGDDPLTFWIGVGLYALPSLAVAVLMGRTILARTDPAGSSGVRVAADQVALEHVMGVEVVPWAVVEQAVVAQGDDAKPELHLRCAPGWAADWFRRPGLQQMHPDGRSYPRPHPTDADTIVFVGLDLLGRREQDFLSDVGRRVDVRR